MGEYTGSLRLTMIRAEYTSVEHRTGAQTFRCNYDMKNSRASCHINPFVEYERFLMYSRI